MSKIRTVPMIPDMHPEHRNFLQELRSAVVQLQSSSIPPDDPSNLRVTPIATGNNVQFTRSRNAQRYTLYISNAAPTRDASNSGQSIAIDLGDANYYNDIVGQSNYTRYYWVKAWNGTNGSRLIGPIKGVTGASGSTADPPKQVPPGTISIDQTTNLPVATKVNIIPGGGGRGAPLD